MSVRPCMLFLFFCSLISCNHIYPMDTEIEPRSSVKEQNLDVSSSSFPKKSRLHQNRTSLDTNAATFTWRLLHQNRTSPNAYADTFIWRLREDMEQYDTTLNSVHQGNVFQHSVWVARGIEEWFGEAKNRWVNRIDHKFKRLLVMAGFLHDIGKCGDGVTRFETKPEHADVGCSYILGEKAYTFQSGESSTTCFKNHLMAHLGFDEEEVKLIAILVGIHPVFGEDILRDRKAFDVFIQKLKNLVLKVGYNNGRLSEELVRMAIMISAADVRGFVPIEYPIENAFSAWQGNIGMARNAIPRDYRGSPFNTWHYPTNGINKRGELLAYSRPYIAEDLAEAVIKAAKGMQKIRQKWVGNRKVATARVGKDEPYAEYTQTEVMIQPDISKRRAENAFSDANLSAYIDELQAKCEWSLNRANQDKLQREWGYKGQRPIVFSKNRETVALLDQHKELLLNTLKQLLDREREYRSWYAFYHGYQGCAVNTEGVASLGLGFLFDCYSEIAFWFSLLPQGNGQLKTLRAHSRYATINDLLRQFVYPFYTETGAPRNFKGPNHSEPIVFENIEPEYIQHAISINLSFFHNATLPQSSTVKYFLESSSMLSINVNAELARVFKALELDTQQIDKIANLYQHYFSNAGGHLLQIFVAPDVVNDLAYLSHNVGIPFSTHIEAPYSEECRYGPRDNDLTAGFTELHGKMVDIKSFLNLYRTQSEIYANGKYYFLQGRLFVAPHIFCDESKVKIFRYYSGKKPDETAYWAEMHKLFESIMTTWVKNKILFWLSNQQTAHLYPHSKTDITRPLAWFSARIAGLHAIEKSLESTTKKQPTVVPARAMVTHDPELDAPPPPFMSGADPAPPPPPPFMGGADPVVPPLEVKPDPEVKPDTTELLKAIGKGSTLRRSKKYVINWTKRPKTGAVINGYVLISEKSDANPTMYMPQKDGSLQSSDGSITIAAGQWEVDAIADETHKKIAREAEPIAKLEKELKELEK